MESAPAQASSLTPSQQRAVEARGNVLVMAGAGTGKTRTLIERCLDCLERDHAALAELLIVTFTEAAATEMRDRLRREIEAKTQTINSDFWNEQLARFDLAHIGTLHSFCFKLIREHFYQLGLDPRLVILDEGEARRLAEETLAARLAAHYAGDDEFSRSVQELIQIHGGGRDENIRRLVLRLHHYSQARPDAPGWLAGQREKFSADSPREWETWLFEAIKDWRDTWLPVLQNLKRANVKAAELLDILADLKGADFSRDTAAEVLQEVVAADEGAWPPKSKTTLRRPLKELFEDAQFLRSVAIIKEGRDPLREDWSWIRQHMETLLRLAEEFAVEFDRAKRAEGTLDFHDLEQFALQLLWDFSADRATEVAQGWREKLRFLFVDEYQDINAAQDKIIAALARDGAESNRFLVGDVKQSIYRFRLADPKIFREYARAWRNDVGETIPLTENFRSREGILNLVNSVFRLLMRADVGGINYDAEAELKPGSQSEPAAAPAIDDSLPNAELVLRFKGGQVLDGASDELSGLDDTQCEARLVAQRLKQLRADKFEIVNGGVSRPVEWKDMAVLLRSPKGRSEIFMKEFERAGIPLAVARGGFYDSTEILDLISLLQLLDNPLQDVPCIAVLRSPLVALSLNELAQIWLSARDGHFWTALKRTQHLAAKNQAAEFGIQAGTAGKIRIFLERFERWRKLARQVSLSQCLDTVLAETFYADWLRAQPRGAQRAANVASFLHLAQQFNQFQRQGLFRFLKFIEAQREAEVEPEVPAQATDNAVRLMSIHQSKGLEFPVVVLADLAKTFNEQDLRAEIVFDEQFGLCPKVKPPHTGRRYPSLPHWLARRRQKRELLGEELRLLYVALTRARDHLILTASVTEKSWTEQWLPSRPVTAQSIAGARCFADWLAMWFGRQREKCGVADEQKGVLPELRWQLFEDAGVTSEFEPEPAGPSAPAPLSAPMAIALRERLAWSFPFQAATMRKAKSSVTALRREAEELDDEAEKPFPGRRASTFSRRRAADKKPSLSASEIGAAHHKFLQYMALEPAGRKADDLAIEADRLLRENYLSPEEREALNLTALAEFWGSDLGRKISAQAANVRRELPFTARFAPLELEKIMGHKTEPGLENEFIVVQGVADLVVLLPEEIWLLDFKTDNVEPAGLPEKIKMYQPQITLYAVALEKTIKRRVTLKALHFLAVNETKIIP